MISSVPAYHNISTMQKIIHTNYKKGFTLIELLVVIAIIGILSSIILVSLNTARQKGMDGAVKGDLATIRTQAALDYSGNNNSYSISGTPMTSIASGVASPGWTGTPGAAPLFVATGITTGDKTVGNALANTYSNAAGNIVKYSATPSTFFAVAKLSTGKYWCVDSNGYGGTIQAIKVPISPTGTCS